MSVYRIMATKISRANGVTFTIHPRDNKPGTIIFIFQEGDKLIAKEMPLTDCRKYLTPDEYYQVYEHFQHS